MARVKAAQENQDMGMATAAETAAPAAPEQEAEISVEKSADAEAGVQQENGKCYEIICRNPVSKTIGGVTFVNGTGRTEDAFAASWFANKDGYTVKKRGE